MVPIYVQIGLIAGLHSVGYYAGFLELTAALRITLESSDIAEQWLMKKPVFSSAKAKTGIAFSPWFLNKFHS